MLLIPTDQSGLPNISILARNISKVPKVKVVNHISIYTVRNYICFLTYAMSVMYYTDEKPNFIVLYVFLS